MNHQTLGIIIGGLIPALAFGVSGIFAKASIEKGIGLGIYLVIIGIAVVITGIIFFMLQPEKTLSAPSGLYALAAGVTWGLGAGFVAIALMKFQIPLGKLVPLFNMNTLVTVLLALWIFAEWKQVKVPQLLLGSVLIVIGGTLVAKA